MLVARSYPLERCRARRHDPLHSIQHEPWHPETSSPCWWPGAGLRQQDSTRGRGPHRRQRPFCL